MTNVLHAIILGIVQGLTELLPISSSAHLYAIPKLFNWEAIGDFDVALHAGTLLAIAIFFFKDWVKLFVGGYKKVFKKEDSFDGKMFWYLVYATIPGGIIGFVLDKFCGDFLTNHIIIGLALIVMGILLYVVDKNSKNDIDYENMNFKQTFIIGCSQALAFIPGVSRSGITMTAGRLLGIKREAVARYSFLLSTPIVFAATIFKLGDFVFNTAFFAGVFASFVVGLLVIKFLLNYLKKGDFKWFAIYRIIAGLIVLFLIK